MSKLSGWKMMCLTVAGVALSLLAVNAVRADSFSDQAAKLDILGVHIGMTPAEVKNVLAQHRKGMQWQEEKGDLGIQEDQFLARASVVWGNVGNSGAERVVVVFSPPPGGPKVLAVERTLWLDQSQATTIETLANSLTDKFGQPLTKSPPNSTNREFFWAWDKAGQISKPNQSNIVNRRVLLIFESPSTMRYLLLPVLQQQDDGGCAMVVRARITSNNGGVATSLEMTLTDAHDALQAAIAANDHVKHVQEARKEEALKKASANKAPAL